MPVPQAADFQRHFNNGEVEVSQETDFLITRLSLNVIANQATYVLPDYVKSISRVTWLGFKLDPIPQRNFREVFEPGTQTSTPFWYQYNNQTTQNQISLFPIPSINVPVVTQLWGSDIQNGVIVEFTRLADNVNAVLPSWVRSRLVKRYVKKQLATVEGPNQSLKKAQLYNKLWLERKAQFQELIYFLRNNPRKLIMQQMIVSNYYPASPVLPIDMFGIGVDPGE